MVETDLPILPELRRVQNFELVLGKQAFTVSKNMRNHSYVPVMLLLLGFCGAFSLVCAEETNRSSPTNTFASINRSKIYYHQQGTGAMAVFFVSGLGEDHTTWRAVQDRIAGTAFTVSYDRSGLGKSDYHGEPKDLTSMANELHDLIAAIKPPVPLILVGHSLGCQIVKKYAALHPDNIHGIVFVDPGFNELNLKKAIPDSVWQEREQKLKKYLPPMNAAQELEMKNLNASCEAADKITTPFRFPVVLFTATKISPGFPGSTNEVQVKKETHELWLRSFPNASHINVAESRHYIHNDVPETVIAEISRMLKSDKSN